MGDLLVTPAQRNAKLGDDHRSLRAEVYERLREQIVEGELQPGQRLVERDLADALGVSRVPVREALRQLQLEALVDVTPRRGTSVTEITEESVRELFEVRESLESLAARLAARNATEASLTDLRRQLDLAYAATYRKSTKGEADPGSPSRLADIAVANADFHAVMVELSGNSLLRSIMRPLNSRLRRLFRFTSYRDPVEQYEDHVHLYDAIAAGDEIEAERHAREHVMSGLKPTLELLQGKVLDSTIPPGLGGCGH
jgi:DNA-binding GntR family transcriptional regulator